jgi:hypothetical protein
VAPAVASQEDYVASLQFTGHKDIGGITEWGGYLKLLRIG